MRSLLNEEINRVRCLMNLPKILLEHTITDDLLKSIVTKLVSETGSSKEIDNFLLGLNKVDTLGDKINSWSKLQSKANSLGKTVSEIAPNVSDDLFRFFVSKEAPENIQKSFKKIVTNSVFGKDLLEVYSKWNKGANLTIKEIDTLKTEMLNLYNSLENQYFKTAIDNTNIIKRVKGEMEPYYKTQKNISPKPEINVGKILVDDSAVTTKLSNNRYGFRDKFKTLFRVVMDKYGQNWESVLGEEIAREEKRVLDLLENLFGLGKNWKFNPVVDGITKEGNITKLREFMSNYKIFGNVEGKYNPFNFFDTNRIQNTNFFLKAAEDLLSPEEFKKLKEGIVDNVDSAEVKEIFNNLFKKLENFEDPKVKKIWDDVLINPESKYLLKTESKSMGDLGIQTFRNWINDLGYKVIWSGVDGSPVDRILGIDAIIEINGVMYTVQVKTGVFKVYGKETIQVGEGEILEFYRVWSKTRKEFDSGGNVQYGSIVDKNGNIMMFGEQGKVSMTDGELTVDMSNVKITTLQAGGITKILDNKNGLTTYVKLGEKK